jgi:MEMO1 family protein
LEPVQARDKSGRPYIRLADPLRLAKTDFFFPSEWFFIVEFLDGRHSLSEISSKYSRKFRAELSERRISKLIKNLDRVFLLDNQRFHKRFNIVAKHYRSVSVRESAYAGQSYAEDAVSLRAEIDDYEAKTPLDPVIAKMLPGKKITAVVAPHIDPRLGGSAYVSAYQPLMQAPPETLFIILGISHHAMRNTFALTDKTFSGPEGQIPADKKLIRQLASACKTDFFHDELLHRDEHSIEFQTVFLRHFVRSPFTIVPILCSFTHTMTEREAHQFAEFTDALQTVISQEDRNVVIVAGVDLSHVGPRYGDSQTPDSFRLSEVETFDRQVLSAVMQKDKKTFDMLFESSNNQYNVCGYPALRTLMQILPPSHPLLLSYDNAIMDDLRSTVTFASLLFHSIQ